MNSKDQTITEYKGLLFSVAYNMLGDVAAAEDIVQDTFLKWMQTQTDDIRHTKAYLVKTVTNKCINYLNSARVKREEYIGLWLPEPLLNYDPNRNYKGIESYHALSIGILVLLEKLTPQERAVFLLKEVFAYDYYELAEMLDKTEDNCRQIFKRAKENLGKDIKRFEVDIKVHEKMLHEFVAAATEGNLNHLITLLKEDIIFYGDGGGHSLQVKDQRLSAPLKPIKGRDHVSRLIVSSLDKVKRLPAFKTDIIISNGLPSTISYANGEPVALITIEPEGDQIKNIYIQTNPHKLKRFK